MANFAKLKLAIANNELSEEMKAKKLLLQARHLLRKQGEETTLKGLKLYSGDSAISSEETQAII